MKKSFVVVIIDFVNDWFVIVIDFEIDFEFGEAGSRTLELAT